MSRVHCLSQTLPERLPQVTSPCSVVVGLQATPSHSWPLPANRQRARPGPAGVLPAAGPAMLALLSRGPAPLTPALLHRLGPNSAWTDLQVQSVHGDPILVLCLLVSPRPDGLAAAPGHRPWMRRKEKTRRRGPRGGRGRDARVWTGTLLSLAAAS